MCLAFGLLMEAALLALFHRKYAVFYVFFVFFSNSLDGGNKALAKLVDLDTQAQTFSEIWGWRLRIGNFFSADFKPVAFQYLWAKLVEAESLSPVAAAYQSVLYNIKWLDDTSSSPLIEEWRTAMKNENINDTALSIRFNVDLYEKDSRKNSFTYGRITGKRTL